MTHTFDRLLLDENPDAVIVTTPDTIVVHWNRGAEAIYGYTPDEAIGRRLPDLIVPEMTQSEITRLLEGAMRAGSLTAEGVRRRKDGTTIYIDVSCKVIRGGEGNVEWLLITQKDITALKVLRDAKLVEAKFGSLLESVPDGIVMSNSSGRIVLANAQAERLFGYERGELRGRPIETLLPERLHRSHVGHRAGYFLQPRMRSMGASLSLSGRRSDGTEFPLEVSLSPVETGRGRTFLLTTRAKF